MQTAIIPLLPGTYTFQLLDSDGTLIGTDDITVLVTTEGNVTPIAKAGPPQTVAVGTRAVLDGSGSLDEDGDSLSYHWSVGNNPGGKRSVAGRANGCSRKRNGRKRRGGK